MRTPISISALAFGVALVATPAHAQLNLGGNAPLIQLGGSGETVGVNLGSEVGVSVELGGTPDVTVDLNSGGDGDITVDLPSGDSGDDTGSVLDLDGDDDAIGVDLNSGDDNDVVVGLPGDDAVYVDLFGDGADTATRLVDLNNEADAVVDLDTGNDGVIVDLFGEEPERLAIVTPHRAQNNAITRRLSQLLAEHGGEVTLPVIDTVERLQGAEQQASTLSAQLRTLEEHFGAISPSPT